MGTLTTPQTWAAHLFRDFWTYLPAWPYVVVVIVVCLVAMFGFGGILQYFDDLPWILGIRAAIRKQHEHKSGGRY